MSDLWCLGCAEGPAALRAMTALAGDASLPASLSQEAASSGEVSSAEDQAPTEEHGTSELSSKAMNDAETPVHYFIMGPDAAWQSTSAWPPPDLAPEPYTLFLGRCATTAHCPSTGLPNKAISCLSGSGVHYFGVSFVSDQ